MSRTCEVEEERSERGRSAGDMGALALYLKEIQRIPVLTPAEERQLAERIRNGERGALETLVRRNLRFVVAVARPYARHGVSLEDLINEGNIGLIRAAERFDVTRGFRFISYAVWWIRQSILLYLTEQSRTVRLPVSKVHILARMQRQSEQLTQQLGREPTVDELGKRLQIPPTQVEWLRTLPTSRFSLDEPAEGEESDFDIGTLQNTAYPSSEETLIESLRARDVQGTLSLLDPRGADIVKRYFGLEGREPESLERIGKTYGLTRERVRQLRDRAIWKLRTSPEAELLADYAE